MLRQLKLFNNITLNSGRDSHFVFNNFNNYIAFLSRSFAERLIDYNNYRVNTGTIKISLNYLTKTNLSKITYAIEYEASDDFSYYYYYRCYFIKGYDLVSGYVVFYVEQDRWANNIEKANIFDLDVKRSNRLLGNGIFDEVKHTKGDYDIHYWAGMDEQGYTAIGANHVAIAVLLQFNISQQVFGSDKISRTIMFITDTAEWVYNEEKSHIQSAYKYSSYLELLAGAVGTITGVTGNLGSLDAQVIKAWVVDTHNIDYRGNHWHIEANCKYGGGSATIDLTYLEPYESTEEVRIDDITPNKVYYIGTYLNGFKLKPYCEKYNNKYVLKFNLTYIVDDNEIKIVASQGERVKDITNMFELYLNTNASQTTALRLFARSWSQAVGMGKGAISDFTRAGGGGAGGVMAGLGITKGIADMIPQNPSFENAIGGGDAMRTFALPCEIDNDENILAPYVRSPYTYISFDSAFDEDVNACIYGMSYEKKFIYSFNAIFNDNDYPKYSNNYRDFLQCECEIANVQSDDANYIVNELRRGIFIELLNV